MCAASSTAPTVKRRVTNERGSRFRRLPAALPKKSNPTPAIIAPSPNPRRADASFGVRISALAPDGPFAGDDAAAKGADPESARDIGMESAADAAIENEKFPATG